MNARTSTFICAGVNLHMPSRNIRLITFLIVFALGSKLYSQSSIEGRVLDNDNKPIPYVNIGIPNKGIGTLSNEDGSFFIVIGNKYKNDTLTFSAIGFNRRDIPLTEN